MKINRLEKLYNSSDPIRNDSNMKTHCLEEDLSNSCGVVNDTWLILEVGAMFAGAYHGFFDAKGIPFENKDLEFHLTYLPIMVHAGGGAVLCGIIDSICGKATIENYHKDLDTLFPTAIKKTEEEFLEESCKTMYALKHLVPRTFSSGKAGAVTGAIFGSTFGAANGALNGGLKTLLGYAIGYVVGKVLD